MSKTNQIALLLRAFCFICISVICGTSVLAQKTDTTITSIRSKRIVKTPQIKANIPIYKPRYNFGFIPYSDLVSGSKTFSQNQLKPEKILTVLKVYPNPVSDQINVIVRIDKESNFSVKIMDLLGNEVVTLSNERIQTGEQTKNFTIPNRLNAGIYFLKIVAGTETVVKRISVL